MNLKRYDNSSRPNFLIRFLFSSAIIILFTSCTPARFSIYSRPGGSEVYLDNQFVARTVNEVTPVKIEVQGGEHSIRVLREGFNPWERTVKAIINRDVPVMADLAPIPPQPPYIPIGSMEIHTRQNGVRLYLNEKIIGSTKQDGTPVAISDMSPGTYFVKAEKDGYEAIEERYSVFANQTTRVNISLVPMKPYYCYPNNDDLLRQTTIRTVRGIANLPGMRSNKSIAVVNLSGDGDDSLRALVEDAIIAELASKGRVVAEREDHLLVRIANEAARGDSITLDLLTSHGGRERPFLYDARMKTFSDAAMMVTENKDGVTNQMLIRDLSNPPEAKIPSADQILGYKIVEKTLRVDLSEQPQDNEKMLRREFIMRLYVRLIDARTGVVQWAERFEASLVDRVPQRIYRWLENPPTRYYAYDLNKQTPDDDSNLSSDSLATISILAPADLERMKDRDALFWYYRNIGESYLRAGRFDDAIRLLGEAIILRPDDYEAKMFYADAKLKSGDLNGANKAYLDAFRTLTKSQ